MVIGSLVQRMITNESTPLRGGTSPSFVELGLSDHSVAVRLLLVLRHTVRNAVGHRVRFGPVDARRVLAGASAVAPAHPKPSGNVGDGAEAGFT